MPHIHESLRYYPAIKALMAVCPECNLMAIATARPDGEYRLSQYSPCKHAVVFHPDPQPSAGFAPTLTSE